MVDFIRTGLRRKTIAVWGEYENPILGARVNPPPTDPRIFLRERRFRIDDGADARPYHARARQRDTDYVRPRGRSQSRRGA